MTLSPARRRGLAAPRSWVPGALAALVAVAVGCASSVGPGDAASDAAVAEDAAPRDAPPTDVAPPTLGEVRLDDMRGCTLAGAPRSALCAAGAPCPVRFDAELRCVEGADNLSVAAGAGARAFLSFGFTQGGRHHRLYTIDPAGGSRVEVAPLGTDIERVATAPTGEPRLFGLRFASPDPGVYYGAPQPDGRWTREPILAGGSLVLDDVVVGDAPLALYHGDRDALVVARRAGDGRWEDLSDLRGALGGGVIAARGERMAVAFWRGATPFSLVLAADGVSARSLATSRASDVLVQHLDVVVTPGVPSAAVSVMLDGVLTVFVPDRASGFARFSAPLPDPVPPGDCPMDPAPAACDPERRCVERSGAAVSAQLVATDADVWLLTMWRHAEQDVRLTRRCGVGMPCHCDRAVLEDRTTHALLVARVPLDGSPPSLRTRLELGRSASYAGAELRADGRGDRVVAAWRFTPREGVPVGIRYLDLDTRALR